MLASAVRTSESVRVLRTPFSRMYSGPCPSVPPGRPGPGVGVKKINVRPYSPPAKLKTAGANPPTAILDTPDRAESKLALGTVAGPGSDYEQAVTSCTLARARTKV